MQYRLITLSSQKYTSIIKLTMSMEYIIYISMIYMYIFFVLVRISDTYLIILN